MVPLSLGGQGLAIPVITGFPSIFTIEGSSTSPFWHTKIFLTYPQNQIEPHSLMCSYDTYKTCSNQCVSYSQLEFPGRLLFECASQSHKEGLNTRTNALNLWCRLSKFYQAVSSMLSVLVNLWSMRMWENLYRVKYQTVTITCLQNTKCCVLLKPSFSGFAEMTLAVKLI